MPGLGGEERNRVEAGGDERANGVSCGGHIAFFRDSVIPAVLAVER